MPVRIRIDIDRNELRALEKRLDIDRLTPAVQAGLRDVAPDLIAEARRIIAPARDTGATASSITSDARGSNLTNVGMRVFSPLISANVLESGRRPGAKMPPMAAIMAWAGRKLGDPKLGFVVARAIAREGSPKRRRGGGVDPYHQFEIVGQTMGGKVHDRILSRLKGVL